MGFLIGVFDEDVEAIPVDVKLCKEVLAVHQQRVIQRPNHAVVKFKQGNGSTIDSPLIGYLSKQQVIRLWHHQLGLWQWTSTHSFLLMGVLMLDTIIVLDQTTIIGRNSVPAAAQQQVLWIQHEPHRVLSIGRWGHVSQVHVWAHSCCSDGATIKL